MIPDPITIDPTTPVRFAEAIEYFQRQAPWISGSSWVTMARLSALKGDQVSAATMLAMVDDIWRRMDVSIQNGTPYSEFVRDIGRDFKMDWANGIDSTRLNLIYHNNVGSALMAGRMAQISDPDVLADRPYWMWDATFDLKTCPICSSRNGVVRPADDKWWDKNTPLAHHYCRCVIISLDEDDLREEGGLTPSSKLGGLPPPDSGWGKRYSWEDWRPKGKDYSPALFQQYTAWRDGKPYAHERSEWLSALSRSWSEALGLDQEQLDEVLQLQPDTSRSEVRSVVNRNATFNIRYFLDQWVIGSKRRASVLLKKAAVKELGLPGVAYSRVKWQIPAEDVEATRSVVRRIYEDTQESLRKKGIKTIRLYRGVQTGYSDVGALESWTTDPQLAKKFDGFDVLVKDVPAEHIFAYSGGPHWKNGRFGEQYEYVVLSSVYDEEESE